MDFFENIIEFFGGYTISIIIISIALFALHIYMIVSIIKMSKAAEEQAENQANIEVELKKLNQILITGFNSIHNDNISKQFSEKEKFSAYPSASDE